jgi:hypothetical protein
MNKLTRLLFFSFAALMLISCGDKAYKLNNDDYILGLNNSHSLESSVEGNLITSAIREVHNLDIVFYPSRLLQQNNLAFLSNTQFNNSNLNDVLAVYPAGIKDQFIVGNMSGRDIKNFIKERSQDNFDVDLQVAGMNYHLHYVGGWLNYAYFGLRGNTKLDESAVYRVAVSRYYYFSGETFPSYKYRNGLGLRNFVETRFISARESLQQYLLSGREWPFLREPRAKVTTHSLPSVGEKKIPEIQGRSHISPYLGHHVRTTGIVTAVGTVGHYPGGEEFYLQCPEGDGDPLTSDGILVHLGATNQLLKIGMELEVEGVVYEQLFESGLSRTSLREITNLKILRESVPLPEPVRLGIGGRAIPQNNISTWRGNVNIKPELNLNDGMDFFESLEGMRVVISNPRITGFRGGNEEFYRARPKGYLNLYVKPDGDTPDRKTTTGGGVIIDQEVNDFNPGIIQILSNHFTNGFDPNAFYDVGKVIEGDIVGVMGYESNIFGGAEYAMVLPTPQEAFQDFAAANQQRTELDQRPITTLVPTSNQLTVAAYNIENLAGNQFDRLEEIGRSIAINLQCPDIVNLVEVQDENGVDFQGNASAEVTLTRLIEFIPCGSEVKYRPVFVDPVQGSDGGQPGGNIQVAYLYNSNRVSFTPRGNPYSLMDVTVRPGGGTIDNPARLFTRDEVFRNTRKSLLAEFEFQGHKVYLISNHFNSKFADTGLWNAVQPQDFRSDNRRQLMARLINNFVQKMMLQEPDASIIVLGDFNAFTFDQSMRVLQGEQLHNLATVPGLIPFNDRYSYNFNGNSQLIDHIFVTSPLLERNPEFQIPHINTDFMGRLADHDPIISRFTFE